MISSLKAPLHGSMDKAWELVAPWEKILGEQMNPTTLVEKKIVYI
jgi:hypothetical protein